MEETISVGLFLLFVMTLTAGVRGQQFAKCGEKEVIPVSNFNYEEFAQHTWNYKYLPQTTTYKYVSSANVVLEKSDSNDGSYIATLTLTLADGRQQILRFHEKYLGDGTVFETKLDSNGVATSSTFKMTFYGYEPNNLAQWHICSYGSDAIQGGNQDYRFVAVPAGSKLKKSDIIKIKYNDMRQKFRGEIFRISKSIDSSSNASDA